MASKLVLLNEEQLRMLATVLRNQEQINIQNIKFKSEYERSEYLSDSRSNYHFVINVLDAAGEFFARSKNNATRAPIAEDIVTYINYSLNLALQTVPNYLVRNEFLTKISDHSTSLIKTVDELDSHDAAFIAEFAKEVTQYKKAMILFLTNFDSPASRNFSKAIKAEGLDFDQLVRRYKNRLGFEESFHKLDDVHKIEVYETIIETAWEGVVHLREEKVQQRSFMSVVGKLMTLYTVGSITWELYASEHKLETGVYEAVVAVAKEGGSQLGKIVATALATGLVATEGVGFMVIGVVGGIVGSFIVGKFAGWVMGELIGSGSTTTSSTLDALTTDDHICFIVPMPDGVALARQISHN